MSELKHLLTEYVRANTPDEQPPPLAALTDPALGSRGGRRLLVLAAAAAVIGLAGTTALLTTWDPGPTVVGSAGASDRLPSTTARDWVTYADHVLVVTPVAERAVPPSQEEIRRGEGDIERWVTLRVDEVVWSRDRPDRPAPEMFEWSAWGWTFDGSPDDREPVVGEGRPRVQLGHTYLMAVEWEEARCSPGDPRIPAQWRGLGSSSTVPFDGGVVGQGEFEGRVRSLEEAARDADPADPNYSFAQRMVGRGVDDVRRALEATAPGQRQQFAPPAPCD